MHELKRDLLQSKMLEDKCCKIVIADNGEDINVYCINNDCSVEMFCAQMGISEHLTFNWNLYDRGYEKVDEMDVTYYIDNNVIDWLKEVGIKLI